MQLLVSKLQIPMVPDNHVRRQRLHSIFDLRPQRRFCLVCAPAGFGKSSLVSRWANAQPKGVAWLSLDAAEQSPSSFLRYMIASLQTQLPTFGEEALVILNNQRGELNHEVYVSLANELAYLSEPLTLVLDDYHLVENTENNALLTLLIENSASNFQLIATTRQEPNLPLSKWRIQGKTDEVRTHDLRFNQAEIEEFFGSDQDAPITPDAAKSIEAATEGWVAGLQLSRLGGFDGKVGSNHFERSQSAPQVFDGAHRLMVDYLADEVLQNLSQTVRRFLFSTAFLDRFNAELCGVVTGIEDATVLLAELEQRNLFTVALDHKREWYRYHHLFAQALLALSTFSSSDYSKMHQRAARWYVSKELFLEGIEEAFKAGDDGFTADLIAENWATLRANTPESVFVNWMQRLPESVIVERPYLCAHYALIMLCSQQDQSLYWLNKAQNDLSPTTQQTTKGLVAICRSYHSLADGDVPLSVAHAEQALVHLPVKETVWRAAATALLGMSYFQRGEANKAIITTRNALERMSIADDLSATLSVYFLLANFLMANGQIHRAESESLKALSLIQDVPFAPQGAADCQVTLADLYYLQGDMDRAQAELDQALELGPQAGLEEARFRMALLMARICFASNDSKQGFAYLDEADSLVRPMPTPFITSVEEVRWHQLIKQEKYDLCLTKIGAKEPWFCMDITLENRVRLQFQVRIRLLQKCSDLDLIDQVIQAHQRFANLSEYLTDRVATSVLNISLLALREEDEQALASLEKLVDELIDLKAIRLLMDDCLMPVIIAFLQGCKNQSSSKQLVDALLDTLGVIEIDTTSTIEHTSINQEGLSEPLSHREQEVLQWLNTELSGPQIAAKLFVSLNTLRTHTKNIYMKLDVNNRRSAVAKASELDLL